MKKTFSISEAISFGWNTFKSNWKFWIVVSLIVGMSAGSPGFSYTRNINKSKSTNTTTASKITYQNLPNTLLPVDFNKVLGVSTVNEKLPISDKELSPIIIFLLIPFVIVTAVGFLAVGVVGFLISIVFRMGYINLTLDAVRNKDVYYKTILNQVSLKKAQRFLIAGLKVLLIILPFILLSVGPLFIALSLQAFPLGSVTPGGWVLAIFAFLLFSIPGIILALKYSMVPFVLVDLDKTPSEAMKMSRKLTKNVKFKLLGFWFVCGLVMMLGLLVFGVGVIPASIVVSLAHAYVYNKLLEQSEPAVIPESPVLSPTPAVEVPLPSSNEVPSVNSGNLLAENQTLDDSLSINSEN